MSFIKKMKGGLSAKANSTLDKMITPEKEMDLILADLETQQKNAMKELLSYKTTAKQMEREAEEQALRATVWEKRAMIAIKTGDDALAKDCLVRKKKCEIEVVKIKRDQAEAAGYAAELNASRKKVEVKLKMLKLRKGTIAAQLAATRSGKGDVFAQSEELFDKMEEAERRIDAEIFEQEAAAELDEGEAADAKLEAAFLADPKLAGGSIETDDPLAALKAKMGADKKQLSD